VDNSHRALHGGLLDAQILGDVYIALTSGQEEIGFGLGDDDGGAGAALQAFDTSKLLPRRAWWPRRRNWKALRVWSGCARRPATHCGMARRWKSPPARNAWRWPALPDAGPAVPYPRMAWIYRVNGSAPGSR
jgi:hypothetical protein